MLASLAPFRIGDLSGMCVPSSSDRIIDTAAGRQNTEQVCQPHKGVGSAGRASRRHQENSPMQVMMRVSRGREEPYVHIWRSRQEGSIGWTWGV